MNPDSGFERIRRVTLPVGPMMPMVFIRRAGSYFSLFAPENLAQSVACLRL